MSTFSDIFNPGVSSINAPAVRNTDEYKISYKDGKGGIYESVVRFIPYVNDPAKSLMTKQVSWVKNPISGKGMYVDDPRTIGEYSPIIDMFFKFRNSGNAQLQEFGKQNLSSKMQYAALVQIIKDDNHPELVGKIKVFKFGKKVWDKLYNEEHPAMGTGRNPFHPIDGRYFYIKCVSSAGFNNFDQSVFIDNNINGQNVTGFYFADPANGGQLTPVTNSSNQQAVADYLSANSPDLGKYDYHSWTQDQQNHVNETLAIMANYLNGGNVQNAMKTVATSPASGSQLPFDTVETPIFPGAQPSTSQMQTQMQTGAFMPQGQPAQQQIVQNVQASNNNATISGFSLGGTSLGESVQRSQQTVQPINPGLGAMPTPQSTPVISGIDIPQVEAPNVGVSQGLNVGIGGNIDDVIAQL